MLGVSATGARVLVLRCEETGGAITVEACPMVGEGVIERPVYGASACPSSETV
jgi:hypothetical protein